MTMAKKNVFDKGKNFILQEKYDEALNYFGDLHEKDNSNADYLNYLGIIQNRDIERNHTHPLLRLDWSVNNLMS